MKLAGFNFTKIAAEKLKEISKDLKIETKIDLKEIKEVKTDFLKSKESLLGIKFSYFVDYSPKIALLSFEGNVLISVDSKKSKEILKKWDTKDLPDEFRVSLFNIILRKSNIKALELENELNLPLHFKLPSLKLDEKKK